MPIFKENGGVLEELKNEETLDTAAVTDDNISGAREQEVAEPASEPEADEGADDQDVADPEEDEGSSKEAVPETDEGADNAVQSKAENRRQAAARREREAAEAKTAAQNEVIKGMNLVNPSTGEAIETYEAYLAMKSETAQGKIRDQLKAQGVDVSLVDKLIEEHPVVKEARAAIETANAKEQRANEVVEEVSFDNLLKDVSSVIPEIKSSDDLFKWKHFNKFSILVNGGVSPLEAAETLSGDSRVKAAKQATLNNMASKTHLTRTETTNSGGDYGITDVEYAIMQASVPGISRKNAAAKIKKYGI